MNIDTNGIELEDVISDRITGATGKAVTFAQHVTGCARVGIQQPIGADGKVPDLLWADVITCTVLEQGPVSLAAIASNYPSKGGPHRGEPRSRFG